MFPTLVHLLLSFSISYPYLIFFFDFGYNGQEGMKHQMGDATQAQQGMTFQITVIFMFYFFTMKTDPFPKCENRSDFMPGENLGDVHRW